MSKNKVSYRKLQRGFTLIEVLVAIAIFASLSVSAYMVLNQVQRSNQVSLEKTERLKEIQRAMVIIDNDFRQIALRRFRTNGEEAAENILFWGDGLLDSDDKAVLFTRLGWQNPQQVFPRGEITKVGYRIVANRLERVWWRYPDTPVGQEGVITNLLNDVEKIDMQFYKEGGWSESWDEALALPKALSITFTLQDYGNIERVYLTAGERLQVATEGVSND
ncbi:type II secretion system minor pseudopilin GspJ [Vibrio sp. F74]|uniref:type II secretion system minor pseudopilin GspJ n=1 Tax=Vibrio sp. F74 TaxID=700020 RepID=UPI0035F58949